MTWKEMKHSFAGILTAFILLMAVIPLCAQDPVPVTVSGEKMVVAGKSYYLHQVLKGQTLYSIARAYAVTVDLLVSENGITGTELREGQVLRIPAAVVAQGREALRHAAEGARPAAGVTGEAPARAAGETTGRPAATGQQVPQRQQQVRSDERYIYHRVRRGETLGSIAGEYGITVRDLKRANKGLLFPREGDWLTIPREKISAGHRINGGPDLVAEADTIAADTLVVAEETELFTAPGRETEVRRLTGSFRVAALLPFYLWQNSTRTYIDSTLRDSRGNVIYREMTKDATAIYEGSLPFLETYEGILMAADSLRALGLTIELDVYDTGADSSAIKRLISSGALDHADLIIGPVFSANLDQAASWAATRDIPVVSPVPLRDRNILDNKPTLYRIFPSDNAIQDVIAREVGSRRGRNVIFLYADTLMADQATRRLWEKISMVAGSDRHGDGSRLVPFYFTGMTGKRDVYGNVTSFEAVLDPDRENMIVLATNRTPVVSAAFSAMHSLIKKYNIKVIGYPEIRDLETIDLRYYYDLELHIPTASYIDFDSPAVKAFSTAFMKKFRTEPMAESYAWRGFDIAWFFIGGLAVGGTDFLHDPGTFSPRLLSFEPEFTRQSRQTGYDNKGLFMLHYRRNMTIEVTRPWSYNYPEQKEAADKEAPSFSSPFLR